VLPELTQTGPKKKKQMERSFEVLSELLLVTTSLNRLQGNSLTLVALVRLNHTRRSVFLMCIKRALTTSCFLAFNLGGVLTFMKTLVVDGKIRIGNLPQLQFYFRLINVPKTTFVKFRVLAY
jgi:hypothetical protein